MNDVSVSSFDLSSECPRCDIMFRNHDFISRVSSRLNSTHSLYRVAMRSGVSHTSALFTLSYEYCT